ncbi:mannitol dehydrogenase family protein [Rhodococcus hoagii]|nr:mannitol dehydrogenase family protein [Prescottella equi]
MARARTGLPAAPPRIVHLGLGAFHRSHQAWYTHRCGEADDWGIAAFTGRRPDAATRLTVQGGLYTVVERSDACDTFEVVGSIVEAVDGADVQRLRSLMATPHTAVVTLTITEAAYGVGVDGRLDYSAPDVAREIALLQDHRAAPATPLGRLVSALAARRRADAGPLAIVSCDNVTDNGSVAREAVTALAATVDTDLAWWIDQNVSFVGTSVDRITPRTTESDLAAVTRACGYRDDSAVVAEPFHNWVLSGTFPEGRPRWDEAGAEFVDDLGPYERRKLWLLNGAHSLLAYVGSLRGHRTVAEALTDDLCGDAMEALWEEASRHLPEADLRLGDYRAALLERFGNRRIAHALAQIAIDGSTKLRMRIVPVLKAERAAGRGGAGAAFVIAAWADFLAVGDPQDSAISAIRAANLLGRRARLQYLLELLDPELGADDDVVALVQNLSGYVAPDRNHLRKEES